MFDWSRTHLGDLLNSILLKKKKTVKRWKISKFCNGHMLTRGGLRSHWIFSFSLFQDGGLNCCQLVCRACSQQPMPFSSILHWAFAFFVLVRHNFVSLLKHETWNVYVFYLFENFFRIYTFSIFLPLCLFYHIRYTLIFNSYNGVGWANGLREITLEMKKWNWEVSAVLSRNQWCAAW